MVIQLCANTKFYDRINDYLSKYIRSLIFLIQNLFYRIRVPLFFLPYFRNPSRGAMSEIPPLNSHRPIATVNAMTMSIKVFAIRSSSPILLIDLTFDCNLAVQIFKCFAVKKLTHQVSNSGITNITQQRELKIIFFCEITKIIFQIAFPQIMKNCFPIPMIIKPLEDLYRDSGITKGSRPVIIAISQTNPIIIWTRLIYTFEC